MHPLLASTSSSVFPRRGFFTGVFICWMYGMALKRAYGAEKRFFMAIPPIVHSFSPFRKRSETALYVLFSAMIVSEMEDIVMGRRPKVAVSSVALPKMRPALTPEAREGQMISLAMDLVEERLRNGTASSQETTHFLKLATEKEKTERKLAEKQLELMEAKRQHIQSQARIEELYANALNAMKRYSGHNDEDEYVDDY